MPVVVCRHGATRGMLAILFCILAAAIAVFSPAPSKTLARLLDSARELLYAKGNKESHPVVESKGGDKASDVLMLKDALQYLDADLFNKSKLQEMAVGAKKLNIPGFRENRKLVAAVDGGLDNPSVLVFHPSWVTNDGSHVSPKFHYPHLSGVKRPDNEDDIAFMTVPIYANAFRRKILQSFGWPELSGKLCPCKESSLLHVLPISCLHHEHLKEYLKTCKQQFKTVLAFCPTGVPYSEHSSFTELREFVKFLKPKKIIPTVNAGNAASRARMQSYFKEWLKV